MSDDAKDKKGILIPVTRKSYAKSKQAINKTPETLNATNIKLELLKSFKGHPFKLYEGEQLADLVESIKQMGVMQPIHVRPSNNGKYEILAGHNRVNAARKAGLDTIPAIVLNDISDEDARIFVVDSNFNQRSSSEMKHSELAKSLYMLNEAMKKKSGYRSDKEDAADGSQSDNRSRTMNLIGKKRNLSQATVARYIRIAHLIEKLQEKLDGKKIGMGVATHLSYLKESEQQIVESLLEVNLTIDTEQAKTLRKESELLKDESLNEEAIRKILEPKKSEVKVKSIKLDSDFLSQFFNDNQSQEDIQDTITKALELYRSNQNKD